MSILWIADPWEDLDHPLDTTVRLLRESADRGNVNYWCDYKGISWHRTDAILQCRRIAASDSSRQAADSVTFDATELRKSLDFDFVMMRADPPVTASYLDAIQLLVASLERAGRDPESLLVNPPSVLLNHDGKLLPLHSEGDTPRTLVSNSVRQLCEFVDDEGIAVLKPLHSHQGRGVQLVRRDLGRAKLSELAGDMTCNGSICVLAQQYLENHRETEKRIWFVDGKVLGACKKLFQSGNFPPVLAEDQYSAAAILSQLEQEVCERLGSVLRRLHVRMAGVDLIEGLVTDVNVISPGLLVELEGVTKVNLASRILDAIEGERPVRRKSV